MLWRRISFDKAAARVHLKQANLNKFTGSTGRTARVDRTQVVGYDKSVAGKVTQNAKMQERYQQFSQGVRISSPKRTTAAQYQEYIKQVHVKKAKLSATDQAILDKLPKRYSWTLVAPDEASIYTLAALTAKTGDEFAMFAKGDTKIVVRGAANSAWSLPKELSRKVFDEQLRWTGHSHPTTKNLKASDEDRQTLAFFTWQRKSTVIDLTGETQEFTKNLFDDMWKEAKT